MGMFASKDERILLVQTDGAKRGDDKANDPCNVLFAWNIKLNGFTDLYLFRQLNLLQTPKFIEIVNRKGINFEMNGVYRKQNDLHCGKPWFAQMSVQAPNQKEHDAKQARQWVIRYYPASELWLID